MLLCVKSNFSYSKLCHLIRINRLLLRNYLRESSNVYNNYYSHRRQLAILSSFRFSKHYATAKWCRSICTTYCKFQQEQQKDDSNKNNIDKEKKDKEKGNQNDNSNLMSLITRFAFGLISAYVMVSVIAFLFPSTHQDELKLNYISWNEFIYQMLAKGEVEEIIIHPELELASIVLHEGAIIKGKKVENRVYHIQMPNVNRLEQQLRRIERQFGISPENQVLVVYERNHNEEWMLLFAIVGILLLFAQMSRSGRFKVDINVANNFLNLRKANYKLVDSTFRSTTPSIRFSDVAGLHEAKVEIKEFVDYLKRPETFTVLGAKLPKGALLLGPPGCGKTLLAKAVATEASVPFLAINGTEFIEMIGGLGAARVRDLFKDARRKAPCIIYIDEIDAFGRTRFGNDYNAGLARSTSEEEQTLNQLLVEMDGMDSAQGVIVIASTNRGDILDKALLRRGRFDRHILIDFPTKLERQEVFELYLSKLKLNQPASKYTVRLAELTPGFSGADIANVCNEAAIHAVGQNQNFVSGTDLDQALERVLSGPRKKSSTLSPAEKKVIAFHEAGHALVSWLLPSTDALRKISIVPRTKSMFGFRQHSPSDRKLLTREELFDRMCMYLGGRAAEAIVFDHITTGAENDLKKVTKLAQDQVKKYGMSDEVGPISYGGVPADDERQFQFWKKPYSKKLHNLMDQEAFSLVGRAYRQAEKLLKDNRDKLDRVADSLMQKESLSYEDLVELIGIPPSGPKHVIESIEQSLPDASVEEEAAELDQPSTDRGDIDSDDKPSKFYKNDRRFSV